MARILFIAADSPLNRWLAERLSGRREIPACRLLLPRLGLDPREVARQAASLAEQESLDTLLIRPLPGRQIDFSPSPSQLQAVLKQPPNELRQAVLLSSTAVYPASHHHPGHVGEAHRLRRAENALSKSWKRLEQGFLRPLKGSGIEAAVLRCCEACAQEPDGYLARLISRAVAPTATGFDPSIQLLHPEDLLEALCRTVLQRAGGTYNVAPTEVIPLRKALQLTGGRRLPIPYSLQQALRPLLTPLRLAAHRSHVEYLRYPFTASGERIERELGFRPRFSSRQALEALPDRRPRLKDPALFDKFGMDRDYIQAYGRTLFRFLHKRYWRVEERGLENIPRQGRAVLVGIHRGFMPWDAVMLLHSIVQNTGRYPRFLIHPCLVKFPGLANYMTKLGGILASQENAEWVLDREGILGIYPEGIRGAFTMYRDAYKLGNFGRDDFVRIALRKRAPLLPVATVGSAEIYPILGRIDWRWFKRFSEWPFLPLTPTFPLLPFPLPSKWHTRFLAPMHIEEEFSPQDADNPRVVKEISRRVRDCFDQAFHQMLSRRRSLFRGSIFEGENELEIVNTAPAAHRKSALKRT